MTQKGFTIIELIVVIAIIAVLAAIVLVNVMQYIIRSKDAAIMADANGLSTSATDYFNSNGSYQGFCGSSGETNVETAISNFFSGSISDLRCSLSEDYSKWCFCSPELHKNGSDNNVYCLDSSGFKGEFSASIEFGLFCAGACNNGQCTAPS